MSTLASGSHPAGIIPAVSRARSRLLARPGRCHYGSLIGKPMFGSHDHQGTDQGSGVITDWHGNAINVFGKLAAFHGKPDSPTLSSARAKHLCRRSSYRCNALIGPPNFDLRCPRLRNTKCTLPAAVQYTGSTVPKKDITRTARAGSTKSRGMIELPLRIAT